RGCSFSFTRHVAPTDLHGKGTLLRPGQFITQCEIAAPSLGERSRGNVRGSYLWISCGRTRRDFRREAQQRIARVQFGIIEHPIEERGENSAYMRAGRTAQR